MPMLSMLDTNPELQSNESILDAAWRLYTCWKFESGKKAGSDNPIMKKGLIWLSIFMYMCRFHVPGPHPMVWSSPHARLLLVLWVALLLIVVLLTSINYDYRCWKYYQLPPHVGWGHCHWRWVIVPSHACLKIAAIRRDLWNHHQAVLEGNRTLPTKHHSPKPTF